MQHPSAHTHGTNLTEQPNRHCSKRGERRGHAIGEGDGGDRQRREQRFDSRHEDIVRVKLWLKLGVGGCPNGNHVGVFRRA